MFIRRKREELNDAVDIIFSKKRKGRHSRRHLIMTKYNASSGISFRVCTYRIFSGLRSL